MKFDPKLAAALLATLSGAASITAIRINPTRPIDEQIDEHVAKLEAEHRAGCATCQAAYEAEQTASAPKAEAPKAEAPKADRAPIGYMAFHRDGKVVNSSFDADFAVVQNIVNSLTEHPVAQMLRLLGANVGLTVKPVYAD